MIAKKQTITFLFSVSFLFPISLVGQEKDEAVEVEVKRTLPFAEDGKKEVVEKFIGEPNSTESSAHFQPWFWFEQSAHLDRFEFRPVPSINAGGAVEDPLPSI